ncbi:glutamyl-tRNA reductase [Natrinema halophilum]|uniref:Glutamyl-tRNA reductase n=1 Tax=Natrinema halophilum TaxID=1699371 RepID=A0A7D5GV42_9EURY|nr:glutamyl-tRNA reductase [Natrinema halophilum]QLG51189.1 glutamyl-tRNA reductase [Natrinema halophilum]
MSTGVVTAARVTHESGSVDQLAAASPESQQAAVTELLTVPGIEEAYVLSTCNRVEAYVVGPDHAIGRAALQEFFAGADDDAVVTTHHDESLRHLLRVAAGLESVILGEDQILGQVRTAYEDARDADGIGSMLEAAVTKAIHVGERARTETAINDGVVSLGSAATRRAGEELDLEGATALVVGAGEMGQLAARNLESAGVGELVVANRTVAHAEYIVDDVDDETDASVAPLENLDTVAARADIVVTATASEEPILEPRHLEEAEAGATDTEQVIVDLGQPRDVAPTTDALPAVRVFDLDDLESVTVETREQRADAAREVEAMIEREFTLLAEQYKRARADEAIAAMYESAERIKDREVETALSRLDGDGASEAQREVVEAMADSLVNKLLAPPTKSLREAAAEDDWSTIHTALQLFDPEFGANDGPIAPSSIATVTNGNPGISATDDD